MIHNAKEHDAERSNVPQGYEKGKLMMEGYIDRIKKNQSIETNLIPLINGKTNTITKYI